MSKKVKVIDKISNEVLFQCEIEQMEQAYAYAEQMEEIGIDIEIKAPSTPETLASSLGKDEEHLKELREEIDEEIDSHNIVSQLSGCGFCPPSSDNEQ